MLPRVAAFVCGEELWEIEVQDWIKAERGQCGAVDGIEKGLKNGGCDVWLYEDDSGNVVGFSSLGATKWKYPTSSDKRQPISIIPYVAVDVRFQGNGFCTKIMNHLIFEAKQHTDRLPLIGLFVDPRNQDAIDKYRYYGFEDFHTEYVDKGTGVTYPGMVMKLPD